MEHLSRSGIGADLQVKAVEVGLSNPGQTHRYAVGELVAGEPLAGKGIRYWLNPNPPKGVVTALK